MSAIVLDSSQLTAAIRSTLVGQLAVYDVSFPERVITAMTNNIAQSVLGLELDDTHVIDTIDTRSLLSKRERHHDRCMTPFDDGHLTCPVVAGREA